MEQHYKILAETFVECGVAVPNAEYDSSIPFDPASKSAHSQLSCHTILITKSERIVSFDETRLRSRPRSRLKTRLWSSLRSSHTSRRLWLLKSHSRRQWKWKWQWQWQFRV
jgi:hypothetical protein